MSSSTIRKAIGVVKDQTSISLAKVAGNMAPEVEVLVVKATSHDEDPADEKYYREIIYLVNGSRSYVAACVAIVWRRLRKTHDWIVALKSLMLVHRVLVDGNPWFEEEIAFAASRGMRVLNMSDFRDEAHSNSWDHVGFVRFYAMYLDEKVELELFERRSRGDERKFVGFESRREFKDVTTVRETRPEKVFGELKRLLRLLDRVLASKPSGMARNNRLVVVAFYQVLKESFGLYAEIRAALGVLFDMFIEMESVDCLKGYDIYVSAAKMIDELGDLYSWSKDIGVARSSEYPEVQRITDKLLCTLEGFLKDMSNRSSKNTEISKDDKVPAKEEPEPDTNEIKALPPPVNYTSPTPVESQPVPEPKPQPQQVTEDLVNLRDEVFADEHGNKLTLALFSATAAANTNGEWEAFPSDGESEVTSAWQTPAAENCKAEWEFALVESASNLSRQRAALGGGFDPLLLNGMYDQGTVRQHVNSSTMSGGSASSVALPGVGKSATSILALPAPDGTLQPVGSQDPFAASLAVPPPSYVQMAEMERKQQFLVQEQLLWQQYRRDGMQGQLGLAGIGPSPQHMI
ncbi:hypothetical protein K2173_017870 [Erythroxylum novogranatense]|uniref:ENTH domain-containing protein n=1 Tax=Erythroxylum novogranatense TaxID=1862640 RepID=A0AAV8SMN0_9ROSI|nr:hypothetical protein K2173_017870 [Erythroxylum novogranatense]